MQISVLMSVYKSEESIYIDRALRSVWDDQTIKPEEIILMQDGPLGKELIEVINLWKAKLGERLVTLQNETNLGLTKSLNKGLIHAKGELIARMDSDDICLSNRFELQLTYMSENPEIDIVGGQMTEFIDSPDNIIGKRVVPCTNDDIYDYMKNRCGLNHVTVMFKKEAVLKAGNYQDWFWNEDYYLWIRMMLKKCKFANLPNVLVNVRSGADQYARRGGVKYFKSEAELQRFMYTNKLIGRGKYLINIVKRFIVQVAMPNSLRGWVFRTFARK